MKRLISVLILLSMVFALSSGVKECTEDLNGDGIEELVLMNSMVKIGFPQVINTVTQTNATPSMITYLRSVAAQKDFDLSDDFLNINLIGSLFSDVELIYTSFDPDLGSERKKDCAEVKKTLDKASVVFYFVSSSTQNRYKIRVTLREDNDYAIVTYDEIKNNIVQNQAVEEQFRMSMPNKKITIPWIVDNKTENEIFPSMLESNHVIFEQDKAAFAYIDRGTPYKMSLDRANNTLRVDGIVSPNTLPAERYLVFAKGDAKKLKGNIDLLLKNGIIPTIFGYAAEKPILGMAWTAPKENGEYMLGEDIPMKIAIRDQFNENTEADITMYVNMPNSFKIVLSSKDGTLRFDANEKTYTGKITLSGTDPLGEYNIAMRVDKSGYIGTEWVLPIKVVAEKTPAAEVISSEAGKEAREAEPLAGAETQKTEIDTGFWATVLVILIIIYVLLKVPGKKEKYSIDKRR